jgi:hypothetical protein
MFHETGRAMRGTACWDVTLCCRVETYRNFGKLSPSSQDTSPDMEVTHSTDEQEYFYRTTRRHFIQCRNLHVAFEVPTVPTDATFRDIAPCSPHMN